MDQQSLNAWAVAAVADMLDLVRAMCAAEWIRLAAEVRK